MATFRIALVLVCLMAVGATKTCPDGADSETCSQLDASSLIQLPATATVSQANVAAEHLGASGGLAHVDTTTPSPGYIACSSCMALLKACIAFDGNYDNGDPCMDFTTALLDQTYGGNYKSVLCILGHSDCDSMGSVLDGPANCAIQAGALGFPNFETLCPNPSDDSMMGPDSAAPITAPAMDYPPALAQQQAIRELKRDVCINPSKDDPATWACPCLDDMRIQCKGASNEQVCFKALMCADERIHEDWKSGNCEGATNGCADALLVETNTSMEARVKEGTPSQALDDSLSGKRTCA